MPALQASANEDAIMRPLDIVRNLFDQTNQPAHDREDDWGVEQYYKNLAADPQQLEKIPLLTSESIDQLPNCSLCRFRGMVQDMMDPEYYVGAFKQPGGIWQTTKYSDSFSETISPEAETVIWDRKPLYCSRVPGQSAWCSETYAAIQVKQPISSEGTAHKRGREDSNDVEMTDAGVAGAPRNPRPRPNGQEYSATAEAANTAALKDLPAPQDGDCIVFVYDREESLKLNDVVEVIGIVSKVPEVATAHLDPVAAGEAARYDFLEEELASRPPTSLVPRIHAITAVKLKGTEELPCIAYKGSKERQEQVAELRQAVVSFLQVTLGGDRLAAEFLLLQLVSRVYSRTDVGALGNLSVGLTNCPPVRGSTTGPGIADAALGDPAGLSQFGQMLSAALGGLTPRLIGLPISIDKLNSRSWRPARDLRTNRLTRTPLQLADNTHLVLDETLLQAGQLTELGITNLKTLKGVLETQKVDYDFSFYTLPVDVDLPVLVLSNGKSLLADSLNVTIPLQSTAPIGTVEQVAVASQTAEMRTMRAYLGLVRHLNFTVQQPMSAFLENELVAARKRDPSVDSATMHTWLTIARLLALSHGEDELTEERWVQTKDLEHLREQRIRADK